MKKTLLTVMLALLAALPVSAKGDKLPERDNSFTGYVADEAATPPTAKVLSTATPFKRGHVPDETIAAPAVRMSAGRAWQLSDITGQRQLMTSVSSTHICYGGEASVESAGTDSVKINRFCFGDVSIMAKVDLTTGSVTIPSQRIGDVDGTPVYLCKMNFRQQIYDPEASLRGHLYKGSIVIDDGFGFFVTSGPQAGAYLTVGLMEYGAVAVPNASITAKRITFKDNTSTTANRVVTDETADVFAYPVTDSKLRLMHVPVASSYSNITATLGADGSVEIDPQPVYSLTLYGDFYFYKLTEKTDGDNISFSVSVLSPVEGIYTNADKKLSWGHWSVARSNALLATYESAVVTLQDGITFPTAPSFSLEGDGTQQNPWLIKSAADLEALRYDILNNTTYRGAATVSPADATRTYYPVYAGKYFSIAADIDCGADAPAVNPIGNDTYWFAGTITGNGKTISNLAIENYAYDYCGLFSILAPGSKVEGLNFSKAYVSTLGYTAGVLAGRSYAEASDISFTDCRVLATAGYNIGTLAGYNHSALRNINVSGGYLVALGYIGGIAGRSYADMTDCHVQGRIIQTGKQSFSGGLVGHQTKVSVNDPAPVVSNCSFTGTVQATGDEIGIGGIAGALSYSILRQSFSSAAVMNSSSISAYVGGLVGTAFQSVITDCYASGFVRNPESTNCGGIIGHNTQSTSAGPTTISSSYSSAMLLTKSTDDTRGIAGDMRDFTITDCYFDNQIGVAPGALYGKSTAELTSGTLPQGFSADVWVAQKGMYPRLKSMESSDAAMVSASAITLNAGENVNDVQNGFTYAPVSGIKWAAYKNGGYDTDGGYAFTFDNGTARLNYKQYTDTIWAMAGNASKYWFVNVAPVMFSGSGTAEDPWIISTREDLKKFSDISNNASMTFTDRYIALGADIDCQGDTLVPICKDHSAKHLFEGNFDGRGYTIDNFRIEAVGFYTADNVTGTAVPGQVNPKDENSYYYSGLFGNVGKNGVIRNLTLGAKGYIQGFQYTGGIAGGVEGLIENCRNLSTVRCYYSNAGGIAGYLKAGGRVAGCYNDGLVCCNANTVGGIAGIATQATIEQCENTGKVSAYWFNPYQKEAAQYGAGGIVGQLDRSKAVNVLNSGTVESYKQAGGIAARVTATAALPSTIENAVNHGLVYSWNDPATRGSIAGLNTLGTYVNCFTDKQIQKAGPVAGGLMDGVIALPTVTLVSAQGYTAQYLPDSAWNVTAGCYPTLRYATAQPGASALAAKAVIRFPANDFAQAMTSAAPLAAGVNWNLVQAALFSISDGTLNVMLPSAGCFTDTIVASLDGYTRKIPLATLNPTLTEGEGTMNRPYLIREASEFLAVARFMKQFEFDYEGYFFRLENDLDFSGYDFVPMGVDKVMFNGSFDGNGHKMKNINYTAATGDATAVSRGVFGILGYDGMVSGLSVEASVISAYSNAGGIAGSSYGNIIDCHNAATVSTIGTTGAGGITGYSAPGSLLSLCTNSGTITAKTNYAGGIVGSIPASANVSVTECSNTGTVSGASKIGGIVGSGSAAVADCHNSGEVTTTATGTYAGGVIGEALLPSSVKRCYNTGKVFANQYLGGIVGTSVAHTAAQPFYLTGCYNTASITAGAKGYAGGVGGSLKAGAVITDCYNTGSITGGTQTTQLRLAGVISDLATTAAAPSSVTTCWNSGDVTAWSNSGGVIGGCSGDSLKVKDCYNTGNITGNFTTAVNIGGIIGNGPAEYINCWNAGNIYGKGKQVGGINGTNTAKSPRMTGCVNVGNVTSEVSDAGGMIGLGRADMSACYNMGTVTAPKAAGGLLGEPGAAAAAVYTVYIRDCYNTGRIVSTSNYSNITGQNASCKFLVVERVYANTDSTQLTAYDATLGTIGRTTRELCELPVSDAFQQIPFTFPTLKHFASNDTLNFYAATLQAATGESLDEVRTAVYLGVPQGAVWTSSTPLLVVNGDHATNKSTENNIPATMTLTCGDLSRTYSLILMKSTCADLNPDGGKPVMRVEYYRLDGTLTTADDTTPVLLERTVYTDGTSTVRKVVAPARR